MRTVTSTAANTTAPSLLVEGVVKVYGNTVALRNVSLQVSGGEILGLLGPNGAGKTSLIRMLLDLTRPDQGRISVFGEPPSTRAREHIGYLPEERGLYPKQRVADVLTYLGSLAGLSPAEARARAHSWLDRAGLSAWSRRRVRELSKGMQQKVQLGAAILHDPALVVLDEPFTGLDPVNRRLVSDVVEEMSSRGAAVIVSTHLMDQVERLCDRVVLLREGALLLQGPVAEVRQSFAGSSVTLSCTPGWESRPNLRDLVVEVRSRGTMQEVALAPNVDAQHLLKKLVTEGFEVDHFSRSLPSLDDVFVLAVAARDGGETSRAGEDME